MRTFIALTIALLVFAVPVMAQSAADEAAIREASKQSIDLLNKGDVKGHSALYAEPFMVFGTKAQTRTGHETNHNEAIARSKDNPEHTEIQDDIGIVFLTADSAVHQFQVQYTGGIDEDGKAMPPGKEYRVRVYTKQDGKWLLKAIFWQAIEE